MLLSERLFKRRSRGDDVFIFLVEQHPCTRSRGADGSVIGASLTPSFELRHFLCARFRPRIEDRRT